ncbi:MAG: CBS domain-containing protein [Bacteroidota bacterium]
MFAFQLVSNEVFALKPSDSASNALLFMDDWGIKDLPVVQNNKLLGTVNEQMLLSYSSEKVTDLLNPQPPFCYENTHLYDILKLLFTSNISAISVIDAEQNFKGIVTAKDLAKQIFNNSSLGQEGGIIVLQMLATNYSLAEIARITEVNNAKILYMHVHPLGDENNTIQVSLKYNVIDLKYIIATFERFSYDIIFASVQRDDEDNFNARYSWLIKYLNT